MSTSLDKRSINSIAITPDSAYAVIASGNNDLQVWDINKRIIIYALSGHEACVNSVAVIPNSSYVISASDDETLKIWNVVEGKKLTTLRGHTDWVMAVAVTADGQRAVSGSSDGSLKVWDLTTDCELFTLHSHRYSVDSVAAIQNKYVISGCDRAFIYWDIQLGKRCFELVGTMGRKLSVIVSEDGQRLFATPGDRVVEVWSLVTQKPLFFLDTRNEITGKYEDFIDIVLTSGDTQIITASTGSLQVWDIEQQKVICSFIVDNMLRACAVTPDGLTVLAGDEKGQIYFFRKHEGLSDTCLNHSLTTTNVPVSDAG